MRKLVGIVDEAVSAAADSMSAHATTRLERILQCTASGAARILAESTATTTLEESLAQLQMLTNVEVPPILRRNVIARRFLRYGI